MDKRIIANNAIAQQRFEGLEVSPYTKELLDQYACGNITISNAIAKLKEYVDVTNASSY